MNCKKGEGLANQLKRHFQENPGAEITFEEIVSKFGHKRRSVTKILSEMRSEGLIESNYIVRAGKED
jgi:CRP-like cAMP-binding protein